MSVYVRKNDPNPVGSLAKAKKAERDKKHAQYARCKAQGICIKCRRESVPSGHATCTTCRARSSKRAKYRREQYRQLITTDGEGLDLSLLVGCNKPEHIRAADAAYLKSDPVLSDVQPGPTDACPGSVEKVLILQVRYAEGVQLWHRDDVPTVEYMTDYYESKKEGS